MRRNAVLLVDDERELIEEIAEALEPEGLSITLADNGFEAFSIAERELPALMLVDQNMPGLTGLSLVRNLRSLPGGRDVVVLMMSAHFPPEVRAEGERLGVDRFLEKPFDLDDVVGRLLDHSALHDAGKGPSGSRGEGDSLEARVSRLEAQVAGLVATLEAGPGAGDTRSKEDRGNG
ncbi:PleD family two-component system response regulator [Guyparkeria sp.]|uniref:response regulator n=1 Tax=Guyparkeria sp. TaxID=2035736 RepID=UPI003970B4CF